jgi:hypothetical protein
MHANTCPTEGAQKVSLGWTDGRNVRLDIRWANGSVARMHEIVTEIVAQNPGSLPTARRPWRR